VIFDGVCQNLAWKKYIFRLIFLAIIKASGKYPASISLQSIFIAVETRVRNSDLEEVRLGLQTTPELRSHILRVAAASHKGLDPETQKRITEEALVTILIEETIVVMLLLFMNPQEIEVVKLFLISDYENENRVSGAPSVQRNELESIRLKLTFTAGQRCVLKALIFKLMKEAGLIK